MVLYLTKSHVISSCFDTGIVSHLSYLYFSDLICREDELLGHSLSWTDSKNLNKVGNNKYSAKIWIPENPTESDLINLSNYASDFTNYRWTLDNILGVPKLHPIRNPLVLIKMTRSHGRLSKVSKRFQWYRREKCVDWHSRFNAW